MYGYNDFFGRALVDVAKYAEELDKYYAKSLGSGLHDDTHVQISKIIRAAAAKISRLEE